MPTVVWSIVRPRGVVCVVCRVVCSVVRVVWNAGDYTWCDHMVCHHGVVWSVDCGVPDIVPYIYTAYLSHWGGPAPMLPEVV